MVAESKEEAVPTPSPEAKGGNSRLPLIALVLALLLSPAVTWSVSEFVLVPRMQAALDEAVAQQPAAVARPTASQTAAGGQRTAGEGSSYRFDNLVVNLAGTMGTRYLKTSFMVTGDDPQLQAIFAAEQVRLRDAALGVLSSMTLADLEEVGARNFIRERLVRSFNQTLGAPIADQIYFLEFVVQ